MAGKFKFDACPECCEEETPVCTITAGDCLGEMPDAMIVDLGVGGLSDSGCSQCDEILGEFEVASTYTPVNPDCAWQYAAKGMCGTYEADLTIDLFRFPGVGGWGWQVNVLIDSSPSGYYQHEVSYKSDIFKYDSDCWQPDDEGEVALTKVSEFEIGYYEACTGSLPGTITIKKVA